MQAEEYIRGQRLKEVIDSGVIMLQVEDRLTIIPIGSVEHIEVGTSDDIGGGLPQTVIRGARLVHDE